MTRLGYERRPSMISKLFFSLFTLVVFFLTATSAFSLQANFTPRFWVSEKYDDNIFLDRVDKEADYYTAVSLGFTSGLRTKNSEFSLFYEPQYKTYAKRPELNVWNHLATLQAKSRITKHIEFGLRDFFRYTDDPGFYLETFEDEFKGIITYDYTIRKTRQTYYTNAAQADLSFQLSDSDTLDLKYLYSILENQDPTFEDNRKHKPSMAYSHRFSPHYNMEMDVSYTKGEFDTSDDLEEWEGSIKFTKEFTPHLDAFLDYGYNQADFEGETTDYQVHNASIGVDYDVAKQTSLSLSAGFFLQDPEDGDDDSGLTGEAGITQSFEKGSISITGSGGWDGSYFGAESLGFGTYYQIGGRFNYVLLRSLYVNASATYRENEYKDLEPTRRDDIKRASLGFAYNPVSLKWLGVNLSYTYTDVNSSDEEDSYENNQVFLQITLTPERPFTKNF